MNQSCGLSDQLLAVLLLVTIFSEALLALVGGHFMALSFFTAGHVVVV
jgi:hypothetical protein